MTRSSKILAALGGAGVALGVFAATAVAEEERKFTYSATVTAASDYMFRGISYTDEKPTINLYQELTYGIAYLAFWTSNIDNFNYGPWEQDIYLGIRPTTGPVTWDLAAWYYTYGNTTGSSSDIDYFEFKVGATWSPATNWSLGGTVYLTPDQDLAATENVSFEGSVAYTLPKMGMFDTTISGLVGHSESGTNKFYATGYWLGEDSYTYWNVGAKVTVEKFFMDLRYWDTSIDNEFKGLADERVVFSVGVNLLP